MMSKCVKCDEYFCICEDTDALLKKLKRTSDSLKHNKTMKEHYVEMLSEHQGNEKLPVGKYQFGFFLWATYIFFGLCLIFVGSHASNVRSGTLGVITLFLSIATAMSLIFVTTEADEIRKALNTWLNKRFIFDHQLTEEDIDE